LEHDQAYKSEGYLWIIKPIASSRGAGISLVKAQREFCINPDNMWSEFKNRKKYENKIIQKYISNPYILQKPQSFAGRKFDIRQWVLVSSYKGKHIIYKYHTGYCRFSHEQYHINKLSK
jgi:glutathionylspermidine synthase